LARITLTLWTCGKCRKPRGLHHLCTGTRKGRDRIRLGLSFTCPSCGKSTPNLLTHTCTARSDFRKRKAAEKRRLQAEERKRKRRAAAARKRARAKERRRKAAELRKERAAEAAAKRKAAGRSRSHDKERHDCETCTDPYCTRYGCRVYREGREAGLAEGHAEGYAEGFAAGFAAGMSEQLTGGPGDHAHPRRLCHRRRVRAGLLRAAGAQVPAVRGPQSRTEGQRFHQVPKVQGPRARLPARSSPHPPDDLGTRRAVDPRSAPRRC
jgi:hypothetical protein